MATKKSPIPTPLKAQPTGAPEKPSWKDSPLAVAAIAVAGTLTLTVGGFLQIVLPTREVDLKNKIASLETTQTEVAAKLVAKEAELRSLQAKLLASEARADSLHAELRVALTAQLFNANDPYPNGLRAVRVGERIDAVQKAYAKATIDQSTDGVLVLQDYHPVFRKVSFFFDEEDAKKQITHIVFEVKQRSAEYPEEFLQRKLRDALGAPRSGTKPDQVAWLKEGSPGVFKAEAFSYLVAMNGVTPKWWKSKPQ